MHSFMDLIYRGTTFTLRSLSEAERRVGEQMKTSGSTSLVKAIQMVRLQKAILAVGMFSMFESTLQSRLNCKDGFVGALKCLDEGGESVLAKRFVLFASAINVLKHGRGRSYESLLKESDPLPFRVLPSDEYFFNEGDVSEISTLVEVTDQFVNDCAKVIEDVSLVILRVRGTPV